MLQKYFETQIGKTIKKNLVTGNDFFTEVYERVYKIEVIGVDPTRLYVEVTSYDKTPSGYMKGGTDKDLGGANIFYQNFETKDQVIREIIKEVDSPFLRKYFN